MKSTLKYGLLVFVAVSLVMMLRKQMQDSMSTLSPDRPIGETLPFDGLVAIYFHGNIRCPTCQAIEAYAKEAIDANFADELASGSLSWRVLNYEEAENAHFATDYEIAAPTVVLVRSEANRDVQSKNLSRVWELVGDKPAFLDYIAAETNSLLATH